MKHGWVKHIMMWVNGVIWESEEGETKVTRYGWVIMTDGISSDALPLSFCSAEFVDRVQSEVSAKTWAKMLVNTQGRY